MDASPPIREIELHAREYLAEITLAVIHERMSDRPLDEIDRRIRENIAAAEGQRSRLVPLIVRFAAVRDRIRLRKNDGENFLAGVVQKKVEQMELNRLQVQLQIAKMQVAREILARHTYAEELLAIGEQKRLR